MRGGRGEEGITISRRGAQARRAEAAKGGVRGAGQGSQRHPVAVRRGAEGLLATASYRGRAWTHTQARRCKRHGQDEESARTRRGLNGESRAMLVPVAWTSILLNASR